MTSRDSNGDDVFTRGKLIGLIAGITLFIIFIFNIPGFDMPPQASAMVGVALLMACFWVSLCLPIPITSLLPVVAPPNAKVFSSIRIQGGGINARGIGLKPDFRGHHRLFCIFCGNFSMGE
jgi:hypothetical protein